MNSELLLQYRSMNVDHLLDDELEHELVIRKVDYSSGESRATKNRKLRRKLKDQREMGDFTVSLLDSEEECRREFGQVDEKLAKIRYRLESGKSKKTNMLEVKTRLIHLYFRLIRLKENFNTDGIEEVVVTLLKTYFSFLSEDPEDAKNAEERMRESLLNFESYEDTEDSEWQEDSQSEPRQSPKKQTKKMKKKLKSPKKKRKSTKKEENSEKMFKKLIDHVDKYVEKKLSLMERKSLLASENEKKSRKEKVEKKIGKQESKGKREIGRLSKLEKQGRQVSSESESSDSDSSGSDRESFQGLKRRPRSVSEWRMRYDGRDDGKKLNKFVEEVEFMAEAEGLSRRMLFDEAIHLFAGNARTWYMEGKKNGDFRNWGELVAELKLEFQPPDMDFHYEQQAAQRRQRRSEKFQDFYNAVSEIFHFMSVPPSEERKFDIIFRNLRSDYKNVLVVKGVRSLKALRQWGRKLDSANMWMYRNKDHDTVSKSAQVNEVRTKPFQGSNQSGGRNWPPADRPNWKPHEDKQRPFIQKKPNASKDEVTAESSKGSLDRRIASYKVPEKMICFNCRGKFHHHETCLAQKSVFCTVCGFYDYTKERCPYCAKNGRGST